MRTVVEILTILAVVGCISVSYWNYQKEEFYRANYWMLWAILLIVLTLKS